MIAKTDGINDVTVTVYDSSSAAGTKLTPIGFRIPGNANLWSFSIEPALMAWNGIWVQISTIGSCYYQVLYDAG